MKQITMNIPDLLMQEIEAKNDKSIAKEDLYAITVFGVLMASKDQDKLKKYMKDPECKALIMKIYRKAL